MKIYRNTLDMRIRKMFQIVKNRYKTTYLVNPFHLFYFLFFVLQLP